MSSSSSMINIPPSSISSPYQYYYYPNPSTSPSIATSVYSRNFIQQLPFQSIRPIQFNGLIPPFNTNSRTATATALTTSITAAAEATSSDSVVTASLSPSFTPSPTSSPTHSPSLSISSFSSPSSSYSTSLSSLCTNCGNHLRSDISSPLDVISCLHCNYMLKQYPDIRHPFNEEYFYSLLFNCLSDFEHPNAALLWLSTAKPTRTGKLMIPKSFRIPKSIGGRGGYADSFSLLGLTLRTGDTQSGHWHSWYVKFNQSFHQLQIAIKNRAKEVDSHKQINQIKQEPHYLDKLVSPFQSSSTLIIQPRNHPTPHQPSCFSIPSRLNDTSISVGSDYGTARRLSASLKRKLSDSFLPKEKVSSSPISKSMAFDSSNKNDLMMISPSVAPSSFPIAAVEYFPLIDSARIQSFNQESFKEKGTKKEQEEGNQLKQDDKRLEEKVESAPLASFSAKVSPLTFSSSSFSSIFPLLDSSGYSFSPELSSILPSLTLPVSGVINANTGKYSDILSANILYSINGFSQENLSNSNQFELSKYFNSNSAIHTITHPPHTNTTTNTGTSTGTVSTPLLPSNGSDAIELISSVALSWREEESNRKKKEKPSKIRKQSLLLGNNNHNHNHNNNNNDNNNRLNINSKTAISIELGNNPKSAFSPWRLIETPK